MIIDAMDMLYASELEGFCLVSSDSDFNKACKQAAGEREACDRNGRGENAPAVS